MATNSALERYFRELGLPTFAQNYAYLAPSTAGSWEMYLLALCEAELSQRHALRIERAIAAARLPVHKELSQFDWSRVPESLHNRVSELSQGQYLAQSQPVLLLGPSGVGKTHLATGLALVACRQGSRVRFYQVSLLVQDLLAAQQARTLPRLLAGLGQLDLLVLDEFGFVPLRPLEAQLFFQLCSALSERVALLLTSHLPLESWSSALSNDETLTEALRKRLTHRGHILEVPGTSFRSPQHYEHAHAEMAMPNEPPSRVGKTGIGKAPFGQLTRREVEVLQLVAEGLTDQQIAARLVISPRTVQGHMGSIFNKLHFNSRSAATRYAVEHQLV